MATIIIRRTDEYVNRFRNIEIYVDGKRATHIANGKTIQIEIKEGTHLLFAKIDWCRSQSITFDIGINEIISFRLSGFKYSKWIIPVEILFVVLGFILYKIYDIDFFYFLIPPLFFSFYYITFGRNKYLRLTKMKK